MATRTPRHGTLNGSQWTRLIDALYVKEAEATSMAARPRYVVANGAEGEPGTFKDRMLMRRNPYQIGEGIARWISAERGIELSELRHFEIAAQILKLLFDLVQEHPRSTSAIRDAAFAMTRPNWNAAASPTNVAPASKSRMSSTIQGCSPSSVSGGIPCVNRI